MTFGRMLVRGGVEVAAVRLDASHRTDSKRWIRGITKSSLSSPESKRGVGRKAVVAKSENLYHVFSQRTRYWLLDGFACNRLSSSLAFCEN